MFLKLKHEVDISNANTTSTVHTENKVVTSRLLNVRAQGQMPRLYVIKNLRYLYLKGEGKK